MSENHVDKNTHVRCVNRVRYLVEKYGVSPAKIAGAARVPTDVVKGLTNAGANGTRQTLLANSVKRLNDACCRIELEKGLVKTCCVCNDELPIGLFAVDNRAQDLHARMCFKCEKAEAMEARKSRGKDMKKTEPVITADVVKRVKAEDKTEVAAAMLAPYFGITETQLTEIREGKHDALLLPPEPEEQPDATAALNALLKEMGALRRTVEAAMIAAGFELPEVKP